MRLTPKYVCLFQIEAERLRGVRDITTEEMSRLKLAEEELIQVRHALAQAEKRMENKHNTPSDLQPWLQLTYEIEKMYFNNKREIVEKSLQQAKEMVNAICSRPIRISCCQKIMYVLGTV